jgi:hypothetical protein
MIARRSPWRAALGLVVAAALVAGCERLDRFGTGDGSLEGAVEAADLVRAGFATGVRACLELDTGKLQSMPGFVSTSDGRFARTPLRPIPPLASDALSNVSFADGQVRNLLFAVREAGGAPRDALAVVSLLDDGRVELRVLDGAPGAAGVEPLYGIFALERKRSRCSF